MSSSKDSEKTAFGEFVKPDAHIRVQGKDVDEMIATNPCHQVYFILENCIAENDRDWRKCQVEVKQLKACTKLHQKNTVEETEST